MTPRRALSLALALALALARPRGAAALWMQGWSLAAKVCSGQTCTDNCASWTQGSSTAPCVALTVPAQPGGAVVYCTLTPTSDTQGVFQIFADSACAVPLIWPYGASPPCNKTVSLDSSCSFSAGLCLADTNAFSMTFALTKVLPAWVIVLAIVLGGVLPLMIILGCSYWFCCRAKAPVDPEELAAHPKGHYTIGKYNHHELQKISPSKTPQNRVPSWMARQLVQERQQGQEQPPVVHLDMLTPEQQQRVAIENARRIAGRR